MDYGSPAKDSAVVVIGASAGGIDALERVASALPADFAAPVIVAQHLDPQHVSLLDSILRQRSALKVVSVSDTMTLEPATVYVVPAGTHVELADSAVVPQKRKPSTGPSPSIDLLFKSAAQVYGDRAIAVVLSGTGSDGPAGVLAIKEAGGTVIVQDPVTAAYPSLPSSIAPSLIDIIVGVDSIGALLGTMVMDGDASARTVEPEVLHAFLTQLRVRSGIDFTQYKSPTIRRRLARLMTAARCKTLPEYMRYLSSHPEAYQRLVSSFLIKVTGFFRDPPLYRSLREEILPEIIERARRNKEEIRLWSAGCATGEEAYSIAILFAEILGENLDDMDIRIFATDLDADSIAFARRGTYPSTAFTEMPPDMLQKYFTKVDDSYQIKKRLRSLTVFGEYDLGQRAPFPRIDLVLCRNVLIYFTKELQQRTLHLFAFSLREGGYLVLGKSETTSPLPQYFANVDPTLKIFRREGERLMVSTPTFAGSATAPERPSRRYIARTPSGTRKGSEVTARWSLTERLGSFLFDSRIGVVAVDRNYDIQTINQAARTMLGIHGQAIGEDLVHLASGIQANELKTALDEAFRKHKPAQREVAVVDSATDETKYVQLACYSEDTVGSESVAHGAIVLLIDVTAEVKHRKSLEEEQQRSRSELEHMSRQNRELLVRQHELIAANTELTASNSDLRGTNEHLLIAAEEAEAAAEEVETLNEEMQATSEELETLNEELQATVEELNTTNEELGARGYELERAASERETQLHESEQRRALFEAAIAGLPLPIAVLDARDIVVKGSWYYERFAAFNTGLLPKVGEKWTNRVSELRLRFDGEEAHVYEIGSSEVADGENAGKVIVLTRR